MTDSAENLAWRLNTDDMLIKLVEKHIDTDLNLLLNHITGDLRATSKVRWIQTNVDELHKLLTKRREVEQAAISALRRHEELGTTVGRIERAVSQAFRAQGHPREPCDV